MGLIDTFIETLGNPGKVQCLLAGLISLSMTVVSMHHLSMVFMGATPPHHCKVPSDFSLNDSIPTVLIDGKPTLDSCRMYLDPTNHSLGTTECTNGWTYLYQRGEWNVVGEFNLVCKSQYLVSLVSTIYFSGTVVGSVVFGHLADRVGRKPVYLTTLYAHGLLGVIQYFTDSYKMFVVFKFLHGMLIQGMYASLLCLVMELFHTAWRTEASIFMNLMYTIGQFVLVFLSYFNPNWRYFYLVSTLPALGALLYIWVVPESLRWLLVNQHVSEARAVSRRYAKFNKIKLGSDWDDQIARIAQEHSGSSGKFQQPDVRDLFRTPYIRRTSLLVVYLWFAMAFVYFGINFSLPSLHGDKYLNFAISVSVEFVCRSLTYPGLKLVGRRRTGFVCFLLTGVTCIASAVVISQVQGYGSIATGLAIFARAAGSCTFVCVMLQTQESFPTVLRSNALGLGGVFNRIGSMVAPQVALLGIYSSRMVPFVVLGCVALIAALVTLLMPETYRSPLPDTLEQAEKLNSKQKLDNSEGSNVSSSSSQERSSQNSNHNLEMVQLCSIRERDSPLDAKAPPTDAGVSSTSIGGPNVVGKSSSPSSSPAILNLVDCSFNENMPQELLKELKDSVSRRNQGVCVVRK